MNKTAKRFVELGLNPVPLNDKIPNKRGWTKPIDDVDKYDFSGGIGVCTGAVSGGLELLDFDLKYAENPEQLWEEWKSRVPKDILEKLVVSTTVSGGFHIYYRTDILEGNRKLASRFTKAEERTDPSDKKRVLIETRGEGGYAKCHPSDGYEFVYGDLSSIQKITDYERNILISTSIVFDQTIAEKKKYYSDDREYEDPFPKFNANADYGIKLLEKHGWRVERESTGWVEFTRPNKPSGVSAGYNLDGKFLYVFSTSTSFETERPYSNSAMFCELEHDGDYKKGYRALAKAGFGTRKKKEKVTEEEELDDMSFISKSGEDEDKLYQAIEGTIPIGISYGWPALDKYMVWKDNTLSFILALEGVGKTYVTLHKLMALSVLYGKKFAVACGENEVYNTKRVLIESLSGKDIEYFKGKYTELKRYKDFVDSHFFVFKNKTHYTVEEVLERAEMLHEKYNISGIFIDPLSYFKRPSQNAYAYTDSLLSELNIFSKTVCSIIMSIHPNTDAARMPKDSEGYTQAPNKYDATYGNMFANRSDSFLVYHRILNHRIPQMRRVMEIKVEKVKDISTGGQITPVDMSLTLTYKTVDNFTGYFDSEDNNPIYNAHHRKKEIPKMEPKDVF